MGSRTAEDSLLDEVLRELKQRYRLGIITNNVTSREQHVRMALRRIGLEKYFDVILTSVDAATINQTRKSFVRHLSIRLQPEEAVMVGNRISALSRTRDTFHKT